MKTTENKGFGIIGVRVELSFVELLIIREQLDLMAQGGLLDMHHPTPHRVALRNIARFCEKLIDSNLVEEMKKTEEELFSASVSTPLMSEEDIKNECDLNAIENQTYQ